MKYHRKIVIALVTTDVGSDVRSGGTCRMQSHIGELARKQKCPTVKIFAVLEYENEIL